MNEPGNTPFEIDTNYSVRFQPFLFDTASLAGSRGDVLRMNENIRSMKLNIEATGKERRPDFRIQYDHMFPLDKMMPKQYSIMGMISIPIAPWASKMYKSDIKAMELNIQSMQKERTAMLLETQGMQADIQTAQKRITALETRIIPSMQKSLDAYFINYQENKIQLPVVVDAWETLNMLQLNLLDEKLKLYQMIVDYEKELYR
jgi:outer membrane protein TolC